MNHDIISRGCHLLQRRKPQMHQPWRPMRNDHCFEASTGDYYASSFAVMPFKRFNTVQQAFEVLVVYFNNLEISTSEKFGSVTIREDNDTFHSEVAQSRLVMTTQSGQQMQSNTILFHKFVENGDDSGHQRGYGIVVCDFVDEDDRYPFHPDARVRRDLSSVLEIGSYVRPKLTRDISGTVGAMEELEEVVVLTRWVHTRLHYPSFTILPEHWGEMCQNTELWMQFLQPPLLETLL